MWLVASPERGGAGKMPFGTALRTGRRYEITASTPYPETIVEIRPCAPGAQVTLERPLFRPSPP